jgi:hypothetical protein
MSIHLMKLARLQKLLPIDRNRDLRKELGIAKRS